MNPMSLFKWLFPPRLVEKDRLVEETERLNGAAEDLSQEVNTSNRQRASRREAMKRLFDDALDEIQKEYRK